jgi:hypothetical protein
MTYETKPGETVIPTAELDALHARVADLEATIRGLALYHLDNPLLLAKIEHVLAPTLKHCMEPRRPSIYPYMCDLIEMCWHCGRVRTRDGQNSCPWCGSTRLIERILTRQESFSGCQSPS